jgi:hypothetical protein
MPLDADDARLAAINYVDYSHRAFLALHRPGILFHLLCQCAVFNCATASVKHGTPVRIILVAAEQIPLWPPCRPIASRGRRIYVIRHLGPTRNCYDFSDSSQSLKKLGFIIRRRLVYGFNTIATFSIE